MRRCPDLAVKGIDNFHIDDSDNLHALFSADVIEAGGEDAGADVDPQERALAQRGRSKPTGVWGLLNPDHLYIDTCASYASTPYCELLDNIHKVDRGLVGHSTCG